MCRLSWNLGASTSWNPQGLSRPGMGLLYLFFFYLGLMSNASFRLTNWAESDHTPRPLAPDNDILLGLLTLPNQMTLCYWIRKEGRVLQGMTDRLKLDDVVGGVGSEWGGKRIKDNENLKATVRIANCDRSQTTGECGIFQHFVQFCNKWCKTYLQNWMSWPKQHSKSGLFSPANWLQIWGKTWWNVTRGPLRFVMLELGQLGE